MAATGSTAIVREPEPSDRLPATTGTNEGLEGVGTLIPPVSVSRPVLVTIAGPSPFWSPLSLLMTKLAIELEKVLRSNRAGPLSVTVAVGDTCWLFVSSWTTDADDPSVPVLETPPVTMRLPGIARPVSALSRTIAPLT